MSGVDLYTEFLELADRWLSSGIPGMGYHLWFMNVIIPFYAIAPLLILLRKKNIRVYCVLAIAWLIFSELNFYFGLLTFPWYFSFINYISFMMLGDVVKNIILPRIKISIYFFVVVFVICIVVEMILKMSLINGNPIGIAEFIMHDAKRSYIVVDPSAQQIFNLVAAVALFSFFYFVKVEKNYSKPADFCFYIYLSHYAIEGVCMYIISKGISAINLNIAADVWFMIIIRALMVLFVSGICVYILKKVIS